LQPPPHEPQSLPGTMDIITRAEARAQGLTHYFTGKPCKQGHIAQRYVQGSCTECKRLGSIAHYYKSYKSCRAAKGAKILARKDLVIYGPFLTRALAMEKGLSHYFVGAPCKQGHVSHQFVCGGCFECRRIKHGYGTHAPRAKHGPDPVKLAARRARSTAAMTAKRRTPEGARKRREYEQRRWAQMTPDRKIAINLRARVAQALKWSGVKKSAKTFGLIGCSVAELKAHLESQFLPGMTWDNWTTDGWHVDHIRPCASFDLSDLEQQKACFHYSNLQPLWAIDNLRKQAKWEPATMAA
jgi:hypothetical protein